MIKEISIKNFKSIVDLKLDMGRVNVLIGANGCGKTNILEAIALASGACQNKLDDEFLGARLRLTEPGFMVSEFGETESEKGLIDITVNEENKPTFLCSMRYDSIESKWIDEVEINNNYRKSEFLEKISKSVASFLIFSPEETNLRKFSDDTMIRPLGRRGEGMFKHLRDLLTNGDKEKIIHELNDGLSLLDWFKGFGIPKDLFTQEARLEISDRYLNEAKQVFDQRSTNEGFLYLLFYLTLFNSEKTPSFFAIDNIETSLNPKLTKRLLHHLVKVAKEKEKQVIITTHSPYVLDGLDLSDDEQRLFVVRRNIDGHTRISRVPHKENRKNPLSEVWMSGVLGGLPDNF